MVQLTQFRPPSYLSHLGPTLSTRLEQAGRFHRYSDNQIIHNRGDELPGVSIVARGAVLVGVYGADGSFILTSYLGEGHTFGEFTVFTDLPRTHDISAVGDTTILEVPAQRFLTLCDEDPLFMQGLLVTTLLRAHIVLEMLDAVRRLPLLTRTAKFLLILSPGSRETTTLRFRQSDLASTLGVSRASLNRALGALSEAGFVETGYGVIQIKHRNRMAKWLDEQGSE